MRLPSAIPPLRRLALPLLPILCLGCGNDGNMVDQPRVEVYEPSPLFADDTSSRPYVEGTVPRVDNRELPIVAGLPLPQPPLTMQLLRRGQERFNVYCSVCHGRDGYGNGMVVQRGFPQAASYHTPRLRNVPDEHIYDVITNGFKNMPSYADLVSGSDRWAIIAYVRALQLSQDTTLDDVPEKALSTLNMER